MKDRAFPARLVALLLIALLFIPLLLTACGSQSPTTEQAKQAILEYIRTLPYAPDYQGTHDALVYQIGKPIKLNTPPENLEVWPVKATLYRYNRPAIEKTFVVMKDSFGEWFCPPLLQL